MSVAPPVRTQRRLNSIGGRDHRLKTPVQPPSHNYSPAREILQSYVEQQMFGYHSRSWRSGLKRSFQFVTVWWSSMMWLSVSDVNMLSTLWCNAILYTNSRHPVGVGILHSITVTLYRMWRFAPLWSQVVIRLTVGFNMRALWELTKEKKDPNVFMLCP